MTPRPRLPHRHAPSERHVAQRPDAKRWSVSGGGTLPTSPTENGFAASCDRTYRVNPVAQHRKARLTGRDALAAQLIFLHKPPWGLRVDAASSDGRGTRTRHGTYTVRFLLDASFNHALAWAHVLLDKKEEFDMAAMSSSGSSSTSIASPSSSPTPPSSPRGSPDLTKLRTLHVRPTCLCSTATPGGTQAECPAGADFVAVEMLNCTVSKKGLRLGGESRTRMLKVMGAGLAGACHVAVWATDIATGEIVVLKAHHNLIPGAPDPTKTPADDVCAALLADDLLGQLSRVICGAARPMSVCLLLTTCTVHFRRPRARRDASARQHAPHAVPARAPLVCVHGQHKHNATVERLDHDDRTGASRLPTLDSGGREADACPVGSVGRERAGATGKFGGAQNKNPCTGRAYCTPST